MYPILQEVVPGTIGCTIITFFSASEVMLGATLNGKPKYYPAATFIMVSALLWYILPTNFIILSAKKYYGKLKWTRSVVSVDKGSPVYLKKKPLFGLIHGDIGWGFTCWLNQWDVQTPFCRLSRFAPILAKHFLKLPEVNQNWLPFNMQSNEKYQQSADISLLKKIAIAHFSSIKAFVGFMKSQHLKTALGGVADSALMMSWQTTFSGSWFFNNGSYITAR